MNESSDEPPLDRPGIWNRINAFVSRATERHGPSGREKSVLPVTNAPSKQNGGLADTHAARQPPVELHQSKDTSYSNGDSSTTDPGQTVSVDTQDGEKNSALERKQSLASRFITSTKLILFSSWVNVLLVFVPIGIALGAMEKSMGDRSPVSPTVIFALNAIAIIPLAWMLGYATECVASNMGDTIGALLNVTFGNAVELIIFIIALVADEISIVQASLLGSILANLLLILGMCFLFGGLRFREQLYNSAVTQMSACLLSLSVISLLLPTAFHASFSTIASADAAVVKVSRGTSVILLLVYILYLLFQLKSHSYIYESTPQYKIDEESHPGVLADILNSSSSSESSDDNDTDASSGSNTTVKRIRNALRKKRRRKSSSASKESTSVRSPSFVRTGSSGSQALEDGSTNISAIIPISARDEPEAERSIVAGSSAVVSSRDFESDRLPSAVKKSKRKSSRRWKHAKHLKFKGYRDESSDEDVPPPQIAVDPAPQLEAPSAAESQRRPFNLRNLPYKPAISRVLSTNVFTPAQTLQVPNTTTASGSQRPDLRRTSSLPDRLDGQAIDKKPITAVIPSAQPLPHLVSKKSVEHKEDSDEKPKLSRSAALILLLVTTGLVAACAEFLVDSIDYLVSTTGVSQAFIGLIILPIVGNAAEHVTAVTVASKNKMDLAIGVALGSSIQIALFVTPVIVLLGWILDREMSLYFSLFETVSLFVSAFIVNYLMLDGRSNYLEGALLIAAYVIIAVAAFFYPSCDDTSTANGGPLDGSCR
ncbi:uncharacterized protein TRUGW13939_02076 [Talaromyces rugulosus]|uniref:Sodium/calcium exchanger membrane region domain-containing protein n=1 Tax=Talaromyces rugulosus TaxID=121627 RepID=A0A7H8QM74_TALRU|nr:uncharacterized protein TRUGW13939_02076 [Talaromyces rugulosus]QKX54986.1 hypothetical protein TRUGW13939_02076 [Talaromyces rugulosus]